MSDRQVTDGMQRMFDSLCQWLRIEPERNGEVYTSILIGGQVWYANDIQRSQPMSVDGS